MASNEQSSSSESAPSMIAGHAKFAQGAVSSALGYETGEQTKQAGLQEMREAKDASSTGPPAQSSILGTVENMAGKATGCEGMEKEGEERKAPANGAGIGSATGGGIG